MFKRYMQRRAARKRAIFHYHDGGRDRYADPLVVEAALERAAGKEDWQAQILTVRNLHKPLPGPVSDAVVAERKEARKRETGKLLEWCREAFGIEPLTPGGKGLTEAETIAVLTDYLFFVRGLAEAARPLADSSPPTDASPTA